MSDNLREMLIAAGRHGKGIGFIRSDGSEEFLSYSQLYHNCLRILGGLQLRGISKGDELVFQLSDNRDFIQVFWACILGGIIPVPVTYGLTGEIGLKLIKIWKYLSSPKLITTHKNAGNLRGLLSLASAEDCRRIGSEIIEIEHVSGGGEGKLPALCEEDIAYVQFSSGSTGDPKGVILTHRNLVTNINAIAKGCGADSLKDSSCSWMPLTHDMGLIGMHMTPLSLGADQYLMTPFQFIKNPRLLLDKLTQHRITLTAIPNFGYLHLLSFIRANPGSWDLSALSVIFNGAEMISYHVVTEFLEEAERYGLRHSAMFDVYGMAEASLAVTFPELGEGVKKVIIDRRAVSIGQRVSEKEYESHNDIVFVELGRPIENCEIRLVDDKGGALDEMTIGNIQIRGDNVTKGYYGREDLAKDGSWLDTGDIGFIKNGSLVVTGRSKDVIIINGQNYFCTDLESIARKYSGSLADQFAVTCYQDDRQTSLLVFVNYKRDVESFLDLENEIRTGFSRETGLTVKAVIPIHVIPRTTSGKVQYFRLIEEYAAGSYDETILRIGRLRDERFVSRTIEKPYTEAESDIVEMVENATGISPIGINDNLSYLHLNSIQIYQVYEEISARYPNRIKVSDIFRYSSIKEIAQAIENCQEITLGGVLLPAEARVFDPGRIDYAEMDFWITPHRASIAVAYMRASEMGVNEFFAALFAYLVWEISGSSEIRLSAMIGDSEYIERLEFNFDEIDDIAELFSHVKNGVFDKIGSELVRGQKNDRDCCEIRALVYDADLITRADIEAVEAFDLLWGIRSSGDRICITARFHCGKFSGANMQMFFGVTDRIIEELNQDLRFDDIGEPEHEKHLKTRREFGLA